MKNTFKKVFIGFMAFAMVTGSFAQQGAHKKDNESYPKGWKQIARMEQDSFFRRMRLGGLLKMYWPSNAVRAVGRRI